MQPLIYRGFGLSQSDYSLFSTITDDSIPFSPQNPGQFRWDAAPHDRPAGLRLQIPHQHRPMLRLHARHGGDFGVSGGRASSPAGRQHEQYQFRGLSRQCLSLQAQREMAVGLDAHIPYSSAQTHGQADVKGNRAGQCCQILDPCAC